MFQSQKSRWFALKPERLTYYVSSGYREKKGDLVLNNEAKVTSIPDKGGNKYRFVVTCGSTKKEYEQMAPDQRTKQAWITEIQTAIGRLKIQCLLFYKRWIVFSSDRESENGEIMYYFIAGVVLEGEQEGLQPSHQGTLAPLSGKILQFVRE